MARPKGSIAQPPTADCPCDACPYIAHCARVSDSCSAFSRYGMLRKWKPEQRQPKSLPPDRRAALEAAAVRERMRNDALASLVRENAQRVALAAEARDRAQLRAAQLQKRRVHKRTYARRRFAKLRLDPVRLEGKRKRERQWYWDNADRIQPQRRAANRKQWQKLKADPVRLAAWHVKRRKQYRARQVAKRAPAAAAMNTPAGSAGLIGPPALLQLPG